MTTTSSKKAVRVVVIDDSRTYREILKHVLVADGDIEVVGEAADGLEGIEVVRSAKPDLVTMDIEMPRLDGLTAIRRILDERPVPILVVTGKPAQPTTMLFQALEIGALDLMVKPSIVDARGAANFREVVRDLANTPVPSRRKSEPEPDAEPPPSLRERSRAREAKMIGIVGSTGGPQATLHILRQLNPSFPLPIVIVQHLPPGLEAGYARFLAESTSLSVEVLTQAMTPAPGTVVLASPTAHIVCDPRGRIHPATEPKDPAPPSADVLFKSMAEVHGEAAVGIMLSGSSLDGIAGLRALRAKGALTIAEHETSALKSAGPQRAVADGVVDRVMSAQLIASTLVSLAYPQEQLSTIPPPAVET